MKPALVLDTALLLSTVLLTWFFRYAYVPQERVGGRIDRWQRHVICLAATTDKYAAEQFGCWPWRK
jgi:hypothetical protein